MPNPTYLGCVVATDITGLLDITLDLDGTLDTTGGGAGHTAGTGYLPTDLVILQTLASVGGGTPKDDSHNPLAENWTSLWALGVQNATAYLYYRRLNFAGDETAGPLITLVGNGSAGYGISAIAWIFRDVSSTFEANIGTYMAVTGTTNTTNPNPPGLIANTPADNDLILAMYFSETIDATVTTPTGYTLMARAPANGATNRTQIGAARKQLAAPAGTFEDPGAFTTYSLSNWVCATLPLDPGPTIYSDSVAETVATSTAQTGTVIKKHGESAAITDVATAVKVNNDGRVVGGVYTVDFPLSGWSGRTLRQIFTPAILAQVPPGPMGARFEFATGTSTTIGPAYIGHAAAAGDQYDFDGNQVQLTFDGGSTTKVVSGAASIDTDKAVLSNYNPTKSLIVSLYLGAGTVNPMGYGF